MKHSYWCANRSGRIHYHFSALMNGKSLARPKDTCGLACTIYKPKNNTLQWYWIDKDDNIRWLREYRNYKDIDWSETLLDMKKRLKDNIKSKHWLARKFCHDYPHEVQDDCLWMSDNYHKVFNKFFECDYLLHPEILLGYWGYTKPHEDGLNLSDVLIKDERYLTVDLDYSIDQMKKRKNIIVYKDDIKHMARSWFIGGGQMYDMDDESFYNYIACRINEARRVPTAMSIALNRFDIPYEMWSLDNGDYCVFDFDNSLDRYSTDGIDPLLKDHLHDKVDLWVDRYVNEFDEV